MPYIIQDNIDAHRFGFVADGKPWDDVVLYYWQKRFHMEAIKEKMSITDRYREAAIHIKAKNDGYEKCTECNRLFSDECIKCWKCQRYVCDKCSLIKLRKVFAVVNYPTSCPDHTIACVSCGGLFISVTGEKTCFICQHQIGIYSVKWVSHYFGRSYISGLPYGSVHNKNVYIKYVQSARAQHELEVARRKWKYEKITTMVDQHSDDDLWNLDWG
jgi:hypothetical protein